MPVNQLPVLPSVKLFTFCFLLTTFASSHTYLKLHVQLRIFTLEGNKVAAKEGKNLLLCQYLNIYYTMR